MDEDCRQALDAILEALQDFDREAQERILETVRTYYGLFEEKKDETG